MTIGQSIRCHRKARRMTQGKLASRIGVKQCYISWWETNRIFPSIFNAISLADAFGITLDELVGRKEKTNEGK